MSPERARALLPQMIAYAEGATIECRHKPEHGWKTLEPLWHDECEYRVSPRDAKMPTALRGLRDAIAFLETYPHQYEIDFSDHMEALRNTLRALGGRP